MSYLGLKIGDINLTNINGPVSLVLIVPKTIGPIILLFGEKHVRISKGCTDNPDEYKAQFQEILTKLNELASNEELSIEFYKEQGLSISVSEDIKAGKFMDFVRFNRDLAKKRVGLDAEISKQNSCYYNNLKITDPEKYIEVCSYPKIKWQYSDARYFEYKTGDIKGFTGIYTIRLFVNSISELYVFLLTNLTDIDINNQIKNFLNNSELLFYKDKGKLFVEIDLTGIELQEYINKLKLIDLFYKKKFDLMIETLLESSHILKQLKYKTEEEKEEFKDKLKNYLIYWRNTFETDIEFINVNNYVLSLLDIYITFLESITIVDINNPSVYTETMRNNFKAMIDYVKTTKINLSNFSPDEESVIDVSSSLTEEQLTEIKNTIKLNVSMAPYSIILDVYFILRVLKKKVSKPTLICSLIGFEHVKNIAHFFEQEEDYTVYTFNQTAADTFCVNTSKAKIKIGDSLEEVDFNIDLVDLLNEQRDKIISQSAGYRIRKSRKKKSRRRTVRRRSSRRRKS